MMQNWCSLWRVFDEWEQHTSMSGYYSETLACSLAHSNYTCDCKPTPEYIPVVGHSRADQLSKYKNMDCIITPVNSKAQMDKISLLATYAEHLCYTAKQDRWLTTKHHKLISSGCLLSRKLFNCACTTMTEHKSIIYDALTVQATKHVTDFLMEKPNQMSNCELQIASQGRKSVYDAFNEVESAT